MKRTLHVFMIFLSIPFYVLAQNNFLQPNLQQYFSEQPSWLDFQKEYGTFSVLWNEKTGTPHRAFGKSIPIEGFTNLNSNNIETAARSFLNRHTSIFKIKNLEDLKLRRATKANKIWYVSFKQTLQNFSILNTEIELRISENGNVMAFGVDVFSELEITNSVVLTEDQVEGLVKSKTRNQGWKSIVISHEGIFVFPKNTKEGVLSYVVKIHSDSDAIFQRWHVNAQTGDIFQEHDQLCHGIINGSVKGNVLPHLPTDNQEVMNFSKQKINIGGTIINADSLGDFMHDINTPTSLTATMTSPYLSIVNLDGSNASINMTVNPDENVNLVWDDSNSDISERNVFFHTHVSYDMIQATDPSFTALNTPVINYVNKTDEFCNAFWNGSTINYGVTDGTCINSAHGPDVIYHEYGHAINDKFYQSQGVTFGLTNTILHEAMADVNFAMTQDEHTFAKGFFGSGTNTRDLTSLKIYPGDVVASPHNSGLILSGSFWDLRVATSLETMRHLAHFAKYGTPDDNNIGIGFAEYYLEVLIADDDDGDLSNGTPHFDEINTAFCKHGIGSSLFINTAISHQELENTEDTINEYPVSFSILNGNFPDAILQDVRLFYSTDFFQNDTEVSMTVNGGNYESSIPPQPEGSVVKYYFTYLDSNCGETKKHPLGTAEEAHYSFLVGKYVTQFYDDFEENKGWAIDALNDNATSGIWQRAVPQQTLNDNGALVQPNQDHSQDGDKCFVTGALHGQFWYSFDVDNGKTTLYSPLFSASENEHTVVQYFKWFTNDAGPNPNQDFWKVSISNNGGDSFTPIENTKLSSTYWRKVQFKTSNFIDVTNEMQIRFIAEDANPGSIVEALIDDFEILRIDNPTSISPIEKYLDLTVFPNPSDREVNFIWEKWNKDEVSLTIFNAIGQQVKIMEDINTNQIIWNGENEKGNEVSNGIYFYQIKIGEVIHSGKVLLKK